MDFSKIKNIIKKEAFTLLRNKRILIGMFAPLLLLPILLYGYQMFSERTAETTETTKSIVYALNDLPEAVSEALIASDVISLTYEIDDLKTAITDRKLDLIIEHRMTEFGNHFILKYDFGRSSGMRANDRVIEILTHFQEEERLKLLETAGVTLEAIPEISFEANDYASAEEVAGRTLGNILPLMLVLYTLLSIMNFAVELTTQEKESETLETLFSIPLTRIEVVMGKLFSCILFSVVSTGIILGGLYFMMPLFVDMSILGLVLSPMLLFNIFMTLLPLLFIGSGLSIAVGMFASSYKESSAYITPLVFVFMIPAYVATTPGLQMSVLISMIPILNATMLVKSALINQVHFGYFSITFFTNLLFAVVSLAFMFKVFATEKILFGSGKELSFRLQRKYISSRQFVEVEDVLMSLAVIIISFVYLNVLLPRFFDFKIVFYISQYGVFALVPILILIYLKANIKPSLGLKVPIHLSGLVSGVLFWLSALSLSFLYQLAISPYVSEIPTLVELESQMLGWTPLFQFFFIALTPGICEEILFRGFALRPLENRFGGKAAVIITSIAFAIVHLDFLRLVPTFLLGLAFGHTTIKTKSIYPAMVLHVLNNSLAIFMPESFHLDPLWLGGIFILTLGSGLWINGKSKA